jgi:hypothetical protein
MQQGCSLRIQSIQLEGILVVELEGRVLRVLLEQALADHQRLDIAAHGWPEPGNRRERRTKREPSVGERGPLPKLERGEQQKHDGENEAETAV